MKSNIVPEQGNTLIPSVEAGASHFSVLAGCNNTVCLELMLNFGQNDMKFPNQPGMENQLVFPDRYSDLEDKTPTPKLAFVNDGHNDCTRHVSIFSPVPRHRVERTWSTLVQHRQSFCVDKTAIPRDHETLCHCVLEDAGSRYL